MSNRDGMDGVAPLYAIADSRAWPIDVLPQLVEDWCTAGVGCIQLRMKGVGEQQLLYVGRRCQRRLEGTGTRFWINDSVRVARDLNATGVHLGQTDALPKKARRMLAAHQLIGRSTHNLAQALVAEQDPSVDVLAIGPIFRTRSKNDPGPMVGVDELRKVCRQVEKPVVAIGGIQAQDLAAVFAAGAASVALIGALEGPDSGPKAERLLTELAVLS